MGLKAGQIIFVRGDSLISSFIRYFDRGQFSHVCVMVSNTHCVEAQYSTKVRITPMNYKNYEVVDLRLTQQEQDSIVHNAIDFCGKWYDYQTILKLVAKDILKRNDLNLWSNPNSLICSELVYSLLMTIGRYEDSALLTPNQLYKLLSQK
ncbi:YiiX/YebB-like N1pC/P60 family cysteine hydrolase [Fictibacillus nanhaiensis]|uniref:hypothetical protein n=1 Tax=Fictibacillus nanhaiensis TaxID=742169 RepID=UPI002E221C19|nr:YiiX/YebB-like N1pC/P60 family cysteine hydrolase [Fictibacillus nanhaiensis]